MNKKNYALLLAAIIIPVLSITIIMYYNINNSLHSVDKELAAVSSNLDPTYHFAIICENMDDPFWLSIKKGVERASAEFNVAVELNWPDNGTKEAQWKCLDMAIVSDVDGIITYVWNEVETAKLINIAVEKGIPTITIGTDAKDSKREAFVGVNTYSFGTEIGRMLLAAIGELGDAIILVSSDDVRGKLVQNILISGINGALETFDGVKIKTIEYNQADVGNLEEVLKDTLINEPYLDAIICTSEKDTALVAQNLIDLNKVNYNIIGYGDSEEILGYIDRGVIFGTVTANHEQMGYDAVKALVNIKENGRTSAYFNADTHFITKSNVDKYYGIGEN